MPASPRRTIKTTPDSKTTGQTAKKPATKKPVVKKTATSTYARPYAGVKDKSQRNLLQTEKPINQANAAQQITMTNPDTNTYTGSSQVTIDPKTGKPTYTETLSPEQQQILNQGQDLTQAGMRGAAEYLNNYQPTNLSQYKSPSSFQDTSLAGINQFQGGQGADAQANKLIAGYQKFNQTGSPEERSRIESAVYDRLTKNVARDQQQEFNDMEQRMYNRGIPLDPSNPAYKKEMDAINEKYQAIKSDAAGQAVQMGGQELASSFNMGLQSHQQGVADTSSLYGIGSSAQGQKMQEAGQRYNQALGTYQQGRSDASQNAGFDLSQAQQNAADAAAMQKFGTGLIMPNLPGYQKPGFGNITQTNPTELNLAQQGINIQQQQANTQQMAAARAGRSSGAATEAEPWTG